MKMTVSEPNRLNLREFFRTIGARVNIPLLAEKIASSDIYGALGNVNAEVAGRLLATEKKFQRPVTTASVRKLDLAIKNDEFDTSSSIIFGVVTQEGNEGINDFADLQVYLQDGQHRLTAISKNNKAFDLLFCVRFYRTFDEMQNASLRMDAHSKRNASDHASILELNFGPAVVKDDLKQFTKAIDKLISKRIVPSFSEQIQRKNITGDLRKEAAAYFQRPATEYFSTLRYGTRIYQDDIKEIRDGRLDDFKLVPMVAMGIAMFQDNPRLAEEMIRNMRNRTAEKDSPEDALHEFIMRRAHYRDDGKSGSGGNDQNRMFRAIKIAWDYKKAKKNLSFNHLYKLAHKPLNEAPLDRDMYVIGK